MKPRARSAKLIVQELEGELLVYDLETDRVHSLNETAASVFRACDGETSCEALCDVLAQKVEITDSERLAALVDSALAELARAGLLEHDGQPRFRRTRRDVLRALGISALLIPAVLSVTAPTAAQLASCTPAGQLPLLRPCCAGLRPRPPLGLCGP